MTLLLFADAAEKRIELSGSAAAAAAVGVCGTFRAHRHQMQSNRLSASAIYVWLCILYIHMYILCRSCCQIFEALISRACNANTHKSLGIQSMQSWKQRTGTGTETDSADLVCERVQSTILGAVNEATKAEHNIDHTIYRHYIEKYHKILGKMSQSECEGICGKKRIKNREIKLLINYKIINIIIIKLIL